MFSIGAESHPSWVRGLKSYSSSASSGVMTVAPFVGAGIEILHLSINFLLSIVAPFVGAGIEIDCLRM